jgi:3-phenylpropionate/trans-cinnamate dioxygenase ferredoxin reductase component
MHTDKRKSIRIVFDREKKTVMGFNLMGIRFRQEACEQWIQTSAHIEEVLQHLPVANFDPEFAGSFEQNLINIYNQRFGTNLSLKQKRGLPSFLRYFKTGNNE